MFLSLLNVLASRNTYINLCRIHSFLGTWRLRQSTEIKKDPDNFCNEVNNSNIVRIWIIGKAKKRMSENWRSIIFSSRQRRRWRQKQSLLKSVSPLTSVTANASFAKFFSADFWLAIYFLPKILRKWEMELNAFSMSPASTALTVI